MLYNGKLGMINILIHRFIKYAQVVRQQRKIFFLRLMYRSRICYTLQFFVIKKKQVAKAAIFEEEEVF